MSMVISHLFVDTINREGSVMTQQRAVGFLASKTMQRVRQKICEQIASGFLPLLKSVEIRSSVGSRSRFPRRSPLRLCFPSLMFSTLFHRVWRRRIGEIEKAMMSQWLPPL